MLQEGDYTGASQALEALLEDHPDNALLLHNLGMCYSDMGRLEDAIRTLQRATELQPGFADAYVALGVARARAEDDDAAMAALQKALELEPDNLYGMRNLGAVYARKEDYKTAIRLFDKCLAVAPGDPQTLLGAASAHKALGKLTEADALLERLLGTEAPEDLYDRAKDLRREIAEVEFQRQGLRPDAVHYCLAAMQHFVRLSPKEIQKLTFDIALLGRNGFDVHDPEKRYKVKGLPGKQSGLELVCFMYVGFRYVDESVDIGFDLSREYEAALSLLDLGPEG